jgi:hypothetical protein
MSRKFDALHGETFDPNVPWQARAIFDNNVGAFF